MVQHTPTKARARSVPVFIHPCWSILGILCDQYGCDPLAWLLVRLYINPTHLYIDELRGVPMSVLMSGRLRKQESKETSPEGD